MFCYQSGQTSKGEECAKNDGCAKQSDVRALQDLLLFAVKGLSICAVEARNTGVIDNTIDRFTCEAILSTLPHVALEPDRFPKLIRQTVDLRERLEGKINAVGGQTYFDESAALFQPEAIPEALIAQGKSVSIKWNPDIDPDIRSLRELVVYGMKGVAAYADYTAKLGQDDDAVYIFIHEGMAGHAG